MKLNSQQEQVESYIPHQEEELNEQLPFDNEEGEKTVSPPVIYTAIAILAFSFLGALFFLSPEKNLSYNSNPNNLKEETETSLSPIELENSIEEAISPVESISVAPPASETATDETTPDPYLPLFSEVRNDQFYYPRNGESSNSTPLSDSHKNNSILFPFTNSPITLWNAPSTSATQNSSNEILPTRTFDPASPITSPLLPFDPTELNNTTPLLSLADRTSSNTSPNSKVSDSNFETTPSFSEEDITDKGGNPLPAVEPKAVTVNIGVVFWVQIGSFGSYENALSTRELLEKEGYRTAVNSITVNDKEFYRVRVGHYDTKPEASKALEKLQQNSEFLGSFIVETY